VGEAAAGEGGERRARVSGGVVGRASNYAGGFAGIAWVVCEWAGTGMGFGEKPHMFYQKRINNNCVKVWSLDRKYVV